LQVAAFFSDIGGALGLYLGMSLMSLVEFFELFLDMFIFFILWANKCYMEYRGQQALAAARAAAEVDLTVSHAAANSENLEPLPWEAAPSSGDSFVYAAYHAPRPPSYNDATERRYNGRARRRGSTIVRDILLNM
jgi:predicted lipid-binding transport protein (Tim44 family)